MTTIKTTRSCLRVLSENETNKKKQKNRTRRNRALFWAWGPMWEEGKIGEGGKKAQASSYRASPGCVTYSTVTIVNNTICIFESC